MLARGPALWKAGTALSRTVPTSLENGSDMTDTPTPERMRSVLLELARSRGPERTICPSEAARALDADDWRELMEPVRAQACRLADEGLVEITQKGAAVDGRTARGPIRVRIR